MVERARRVVIRAYMGYGGGGATRNTGFRGYGRTSNGGPAQAWHGWPERVPSVVERLRGVVIESRPAAEVIHNQDGEDTLFYVDPPYLVETRGARERVYSVEFEREEHGDLAQVLHEAQGMVIVSGYPSAYYDGDLYADWHRVEREALADGAARRTEVLWISPRAWEARTRQAALWVPQEVGVWA